jgi:ribose transport system permease protein
MFGGLKRFGQFREAPAIVALVGIVLISSLLSPHFFTGTNIKNVLTQVSIIALLAEGEAFVILTGGIDLSLGSVLALVSVLVAGCMKFMNMPVYLAVLVGLCVGTLCGLTSGLLVTRVRIPSFIATLAMMAIARGLALIYAKGVPISMFPPEFRIIARYVGPISVLTLIMIGMLIAGQLILSWTRTGQYVRATGGNEDATRHLGVNVDRVKLFAFSFSGFCAAVGGIMLTARMDSAYPNVGGGYELDAIGSAVLGGISFTGGIGSVGGAFMGSLVITILGNLLNLLRVSGFYQYVFKGLILAVAALSLSRGVRYAK